MHTEECTPLSTLHTCLKKGGVLIISNNSKNQDTEELVKKAKDGDEEAVLTLINKFRPLILKLAGKYRIPGYNFEDVVQYGYLTLVKTIGMYKIGSKSFNGYAIRAIRNNIMDLVRKHIKQYKEVPNNELLNICVDNDLSIEEHIIVGEEVSKLYIALDKLPSEDREIIEKHYFKGQTLKSIAEDNDVEYKKLVREKKRILEELQGEMG